MLPIKTFEVILVKSYIVKIQAKNELEAKEFSEFFTSDIENASTSEDEKKHHFKIEDIECKVNHVVEVNQIL